jgi:hypothetical protein
MYLNSEDIFRLIHPAIAVLVVFPLIGIVVRMAWQTRQRRLEVAAGGKSKIPPVVGQEHVTIGRWLTGAVVGVELLGITRPMLDKIISDNLWATMPFKLVLIGLLYIATIASLALLYWARPKLWRAVFATLAGMGVVLLSFQDLAILQLRNPDDTISQVIYRRNEELLFSHFYYGVVVTLLMIFSLAIIQDIYQDRQNRWRTVHIVLNCVALVLFLGQGLTGTRDLLEIPLGWQEPAVYQCNFDSKSPGFKTCPTSPPPK